MLETLDYMFCVVIYSYKILGKIKDLGSLARGILHTVRGTYVNLVEKEVRTCTRVLLYISDDDDVDAKILFTEMTRFIIVTYEQFNREKIMDEMTRVLNIHKDIDEIAETYSEPDENIAKLLKTMKLAVTFTTPELTMRMIEGAVKKFTETPYDENGGEPKYKSTKYMRKIIRELISDDNDYRAIRMVLMEENDNGVQTIENIIESDDIIAFKYGGFLDDRCKRWDGRIVSIEGVDAVE